MVSPTLGRVDWRNKQFVLLGTKPVVIVIVLTVKSRRIDASFFFGEQLGLNMYTNPTGKGGFMVGLERPRRVFVSVCGSFVLAPLSLSLPSLLNALGGIFSDAHTIRFNS